MENFRTKKILGALLFIVVFAAAIAVVMLLWNALIPSIIGWTTINYWQAAGLMILGRLLLGGFGRFGHGHSFSDRKKGFAHWHTMCNEMKGMSREEKHEYIRKHMMENHGVGGCCKEKENSSGSEE